jgi:hypothetical protein
MASPSPLATRIRDRAIRRSGELLKQIEPAYGANQNIEGGISPKVLTRKQAASDAGMSPDQAKQAIRVANVPSIEFDRQVESDNPPTLGDRLHKIMQTINRQLTRPARSLVHDVRSLKAWRRPPPHHTHGSVHPTEEERRGRGQLQRRGAIDSIDDPDTSAELVAAIIPDCPGHADHVAVLPQIGVVRIFMLIAQGLVAHRIVEDHGPALHIC